MANLRAPIEWQVSLVQAFLTNERINQAQLDLLDPAIWNRFPPSSPRRNIATTFAHIHNVRCMRLVMSRPGAKQLRRLNRRSVTMAQARKALADSAQAMAALIEDAAKTGGYVRGFRPDVIGMVCLSIVHEAHHRGQVGHWARELGSPIERTDQPKLWDWGKLWKRVAGVRLKNG